MDDVELVQILHTTNNLVEELERLGLFDALVLHDVVEELASISVLHDQVKLLGRLDDLVKLNDIWVSNHFQNMDFPRHSLNVIYILNLVFL